MRLLAAASTILLTVHAWIHPGITNTKDDLERLATLAKSDAEPWASAYKIFSEDAHSAKDYALKGPCPFVARTKESATTVCMTDFAHYAVAALQQSLMWIITDDEAYLDNSLEILHEWGKTLKKVNGSDAQLAAGLSGSNFVNAAEIVRHMSDKWAEDDIKTFSNMLSTAIYPPAEQHIPSEQQSIPWIANWGTAGAKLVLAAGVFLENQTAIDTAKELMLHSQCSNLTGSISPTGQTTETGRDQSHNQLGLGNWVEAFYTLYNQNDDTNWFALEDDRLAAGLEYNAQLMLNQTDDLTYDPEFNSVKCNSSITPVDWPEISEVGLWPTRPTWEMGYAIYKHLLGIELPKTRELIFKVAPDGPNPSTALADGSAFQTLRFRRE